MSRACRAKQQLQRVARGEHDDRQPIIKHYTRQTAEAHRVLTAIHRLHGQGNPMPLPSHLLPPLG